MTYISNSQALTLLLLDGPVLAFSGFGLGVMITVGSGMHAESLTSSCSRLSSLVLDVDAASCGKLPWKNGQERLLSLSLTAVDASIPVTGGV